MPNKKEIIEIDDNQAEEGDNFTLIKKVKRRIIFCIDVGKEMGVQLRASASGGIKDTNLYFSSRLETVTRYIKRYVLMNKMIGNHDDQYAIMILKESAEWWEDFSTANSSRFENSLENVYTEVKEYDELDTRSIFTCIRDKTKNSPYFVQTILIYSRDSMPTISLRKQIDSVRNSRDFTLDVIYLHGTSGNVQDIYDFWNDLDSQVNRGWYYETGISQGKDSLAIAFSQLLSHPLQRGKQDRMDEFV